MPPRGDPLKGRELVLGVTGSIAAYKAADLVGAVVKRGLGVTVVMTEGASAFIGPLTLATLSRRPVVTGLFETGGTGIEHVDISERADAMLVAPATANVLAKLALGIADDALTTTALALKRRTPLLVAPAMNTRMWEHPATQENLERLAARGVVVIPPAEGILACGTEGWGKLAAIESLVAAIEETLNKA